MQLSFVVLALAIATHAADWSGPEQQLARKIVAVTGPGAVALTVENRSSLGKRDSEIIQNGLRALSKGLGIRFVKAEQSAATVAIFLSENPTSYVWVAEIRQGAGEAAVVMVSAPRPAGATASHESVPLSLRKISLWTQDDPILDVAVLEENSAPTRIAVLDAEKVSFYRLQGGKVAAGADSGHRPCAAMAEGFARKADPGEGSPAGCLSSRRHLPQFRGSTVIVELPRDG